MVRSEEPNGYKCNNNNKHFNFTVVSNIHLSRQNNILGETMRSLYLVSRNACNTISKAIVLLYYFLG